MDLYNIPNDNKIDYRLKKFVEYQHEVPSIHYRFSGEWAKKYKYSKSRMIQLCWYLSVTYNEITAVFLDEIFNSKNQSLSYVWKTYGEVLNFGSARKYVKYNNRFPCLINNWNKLVKENPCLWLDSLCTGDPYKSFELISENIRKIPNVGRFASDIFLEGICYLQKELNVKIEEPYSIDWDNGANLTSGIFNIFYCDEKAKDYESGKRLTVDDKIFLSDCLCKIQKEIQSTYPQQDSQVQSFIGKICSFRNLFKNARYGGFHHDRQLGVIREYQEKLPEFMCLWDRCLELRKEIFPKKFLGELNGWDGIRKERKKIWLTTGNTGVEE